MREIRHVGSPSSTMVGPHFERHGIVGHSRAVADVIRRIELVSATPQHGVDHRRNRHRQGAGGARRAQSQRAARHAVRQGQLRGHSRDAARIGAVRPCQRGVHRRDRHEEGQVLAGQPRLHLSRRDRHDERRTAGQAAARPAGARNRAARRGTDRARRRSRDRGDQPRSPPARRTRVGSRTICSIGCT